MLLERLWGSLGASLTALGASWSLFGGSWMGLGSSWEALGDGLGSSSGALQDVFSLRGSGEPLFFKNERFVSTGAPFSKPVLANEREARAVRNHEDIRR